MDKSPGEVAETIKQLRAEIKHWKANHDRVVERLRLFTQRDDLPVDRLPAYQKLIKLQEENKVLKDILALDEYDILQQDLYRFGL